MARTELSIDESKVFPETPQVITDYTINRTYVPNESLNKIQVVRWGKIIGIAFDLHSSVNLPQGNCVIITGLPKPYPLNGTIWEAVCKRADLVVQRCWIDNTGQLTVGSSSAYNGKIYGTIVYITRD